MKLESGFLLLLYFGLTCGQGANTENDHEVKRGMYPYMAFIYYSDPSVVDVTGQRFVRSAVLIRADWLVTAAFSSLTESGNGFPTKTLLARTGAIAIDSNFTLNEDEDEQEREIIQIIRPYNHSATQWWTTDISLMKTLLPFNMTLVVAAKALNTNLSTIETRSCGILVYTKMQSNATENKNLMMLFVNLLSPSMENCGSHFSSSTMTCAADSEENKDAVYDTDFCQGNSGGPLICENEVVGLQTYIGNNCKQPFLYQLLNAWDNFITCSVENKCHEKHCQNTCAISYKDTPKAARRTSSVVTHKISSSTSDSELKSQSETKSSSETSSTVDVILSNAADDVVAMLKDLINTKVITITTTDLTTTSDDFSEITTEVTTIRPTLTTLLTSTVAEAKEITTPITQPSSTVSDTVSSWPKVKGISTTMTQKPQHEERSKPNSSDVNDGLIQQIKIAEVESRKPQRRAQHYNASASNSNMCFIQTVFFGLIVLLCI